VSLSVRPQWAIGDPFRVRQILRNLLTNALRYGGDHIELAAGERDGRAFLEVIDDGDGIGVTDPAVVFLPYYRLSDVSTMPASVGLGLTVAKDLAELMGGTLVYERRDERTVFRLELERIDEPGVGALLERRPA
jgi:signal transduction histidine kinase